MRKIIVSCSRLIDLLIFTLNFYCETAGNVEGNNPITSSSLLIVDFSLKQKLFASDLFVREKVIFDESQLARDNKIWTTWIWHRVSHSVIVLAIAVRNFLIVNLNCCSSRSHPLNVLPFRSTTQQSASNPFVSRCFTYCFHTSLIGQNKRAKGVFPPTATCSRTRAKQSNLLNWKENDFLTISNCSQCLC